MTAVPTSVELPLELPARRQGGRWLVEVGGRELSLSNLDKVFWEPEGYTKGDLVTYYAAVAPHALPYVSGRPLTMKRMPNGADGEFFYAKQAPEHTPGWVRTAPVVSVDSGKRIDYVVADEPATLVWLANLGCIELHPWHARVDDLGHPDYAFFDLDPMTVGFDVVRDVALLVRTALDSLGLRSYPRTSGATGMQVYVPIDRVHTAAQVREWVGRVCRFINRADPERTTMEWSVGERRGVFLDHNMNTEGKNIAATWSLRPERGAPVATPVTWEEVEGGVEPLDFTIETVWGRLAQADEMFRPVLEGGQDLRASMRSLGMDPEDAPPGGHVVATDETAADVATAEAVASRAAASEATTETETAETEVPATGAAAGTRTEEPGDLGRYAGMRDFSRTPEPSGEDVAAGAQADASGTPRFVIQHHLATRLHHDLRLERGGTARSWAVPKGLPAVPGLRHLAVQTEDHPLSYMSFEGEIPAGEYGGGPVRIWDEGTYEPLEWTEGKVTFRLHGRRHHGEWHLFRTGGRGRGDADQWMVTRRPPPEDLPPPPPSLTPMLATTGEGPFDDPDWLFEIKWDGVRVIATVERPGAGPPGRTRLVSRAGNDVTGGYPELVDLWERVLARNAVVDGELVAFGPGGLPSFQRLQQRMHLRGEQAVVRAASSNPVVLMAFDLLALDGEALVDRPLHERLERLADVLVPGPSVRISEAVAEHGTALYEAATAKGLEGLVAKRADSPYRPGQRSRDWRKLKVRRILCAVIGGWMPGEGGRAGRLGSLLVGLYAPSVSDGDAVELRYAGRVGTGFDAEELDRLAGVLARRERPDPPLAGLPPEVRRAGRWVDPDLACRIEYAEATDDGRLRAPSYKGLLAPQEQDPRACVIEDLVGGAPAGERRPPAGER